MSWLGSGVQVVVQDDEMEPVLENVRVGLHVREWELVGGERVREGFHEKLPEADQV